MRSYLNCLHWSVQTLVATVRRSFIELRGMHRRGSLLLSRKVFTGHALANYGRGLLVRLTEAYYLDDESGGSRFGDDGIRRHRVRSFGIVPSPPISVARSGHSFRPTSAMVSR